MNVKLSKDEAKSLGIIDTGKSNKYHAARTQYNGRTYDSNAEANHAAKLDFEQKLNLIQWWLPQVRFELGPAHIIYKADFLIIPYKGNVEVHEVKGRRTERFNVIAKLWKHHGPCQLKIFHDGYLEETIIPERHKP